ncbi:hypothetical protein [Pseudoalteromonas luteoviolacea]|uniref:Uncharacterized protein n=1 Tax=Pseudoalteromonas luteoviolacea S4060-1 TaxID=1365257 RepID=A0A167J2B1_9GAMM|nr:hypothetical protein [Pseudoalteromonas luteoviolacea]KZN60421.1 hypothetical protein N478_07630 [Pseudoalteromonas luteoviolacea S4060-1]
MNDLKEIITKEKAELIDEILIKSVSGGDPDVPDMCAPPSGCNARCTCMNN